MNATSAHDTTALVVIGGLPPKRSVVQHLPRYDFVIAADSGLHAAIDLGLRVAAVVGDLDSVDPAVLTVTIDCPEKLLGRLIGAGGRNIQNIRDQSKCKVGVTGSPRRVEVVGLAPDIVVAKQMIQAEIEYFLPWLRGCLSSCPAGLVISGMSPLLVGR